MSSPAVATVNANLRTTPYSKPKDVMVWNIDAKSWLRIDLQGELDPTIGWLKPAIIRQLGLPSGSRVHLLLSNKSQLNKDDALLEYHTFDDFVAFHTRPPVAQGFFEIRISSLTGKVIDLDVQSTDSVMGIKEMIAEKEGVPIDHQRLIHAGRQLEEERTLADYEVKQGATVWLVMRLRGGGGRARAGSAGPVEGVKFVDLSDESGLQRRAFSNNAPKWRICAPGLNLEGKCTNEKCKAFKQQVIVPIRMGVFDIMLDCNADTCKCPCCYKFVQPTTCAFSKCKWKWTGLKAPIDGAPAQRVEKVDFAIAGDEYVRFNDAPISAGGSGSVQWLRLNIRTIEFDSSSERLSSSRSRSVDRTCSICLEEVTEENLSKRRKRKCSNAKSSKDDDHGSDEEESQKKSLNGAVEVTSCGHWFHSSCLAKWKSTCENQGRVFDCPMDRQQIKQKE